MYGAILLAALFFAGTRWRDLAIVVAVGTVVAVFVLWAGPAMGVEILEPYQRDRLTAFTDPSKNRAAPPTTSTSRSQRSAPGGLDGRGVTGATQTRLDYLPEHETDFVFAALSEQRGFVGASILPPLLAPDLARDPRDRHGPRRLRGDGCRCDRLRPALPDVREHRDDDRNRPITGIPLPFVSVGGSAMVTNLMAIVLQAIALRRR